jgi:TonB family protein
MLRRLDYLERGRYQTLPCRVCIKIKCSQMFSTLPTATPRPRSYGAIATSVVLHLGLLAAVVLHRPRVIELTPTWLAFGDATHTYRVTYFPAGGEDLSRKATLVLPRETSTPPPKRRTLATKPPADHQQARLDAEPSDRNSRAGSPLGTLIDGPITGHEVHVAYPIVFPDPPVARSELPPEVTGDVVIEVTIDSEGNVVETRILEAVGHGVDEKIEATLRHWHYQPATLDGVPVASKHDVHFHFPS